MQPHVTTQDIPYGLCQCGCGQPAPIATRNHTKSGYVKGQPMRFVRNHHQRKPLRPSPNPGGLCMCGCGNKTRIATENTKSQVRGQPIRFFDGHHIFAKRVAMRPVAERFWAKVDKRGPDECWEWTGSKAPQGYGIIHVDDHNIPAHRLSYELHIGPIPNGLYVCHACDNPPCCNPAHLWIGTVADNNADRHTKGRDKPMYGSDNGMAELTKPDVLEIRRRFSAGERQIDLAREYGVTKGTIWKVVHRRIWKHI